MEQPQHQQDHGTHDRGVGNVLIRDTHNRAEQEILHRPRIARRQGNNHNTQRKGRREENTDHGILTQPLILAKNSHQNSRHHARSQTAHDQVAAQHERHRKTREHRVRYRIANEDHAAHQHVAAHHTGNHRGQQHSRQGARKERQRRVEQVGKKIDRSNQRAPPVEATVSAGEREESEVQESVSSWPYSSNAPPAQVKPVRAWPCASSIS